MLDSIHQQRQFHFLNALLMRESGFLAVLALVSLFFMPHIREQNDFLLAALLPVGFDSVTAILSLLPGLALRYAATPLAVKPPSRDLWTPIFILGIFAFLFFTLAIMQI